MNIVLGLLDISASTNADKLETQTALVIPIIAAFSWWGIRVGISLIETCLSQMITFAHKHHYDNTKQWLHVHIEKSIQKATPLVFFASFVVVTYYGLVNDVVRNFLDLDTRIVLFFQAWVAWFLFFKLLLVVYLGQKLIAQHLQKKRRIRIFEVEQFTHVCQLMIVNFFIPSTLITLTGLIAFFLHSSPIDMYVAALALLIVLTFTLYPAYLIRKVLGQQREKTLTRINETLNIQMESKHLNDKRRLVDDFERLQFVSDLLAIRKEVNGISLWPINLPFTVQIAILAFIPILSWTGAGIVSQVLKSVTAL